MLKARHSQNPLEQVKQVVTKEELLEMQRQVEQVFVHDAIYQYITMLVSATRKHPHIELGVSPRGSLALTAMAKSAAFVAGRDYVVPEDVEQVFTDVAAHRIVLDQKARMAHTEAKDLLLEVLRCVEKPKLER